MRTPFLSLAHLLGNGFRRELAFATGNIFSSKQMSLGMQFMAFFSREGACGLRRKA